MGQEKWSRSYFLPPSALRLSTPVDEGKDIASAVFVRTSPVWTVMAEGAVRTQTSKHVSRRQLLRCLKLWMRTT